MKTTQFRDLRQKYQIPLDEIAAALSCSNQYLSALERGEAPVSSEQQTRIAEGFYHYAKAQCSSYQALSCEILLMRDQLLKPVEVEQGEL